MCHMFYCVWYKTPLDYNQCGALSHSPNNKEKLEQTQCKSQCPKPKNMNVDAKYQMQPKLEGKPTTIDIQVFTNIGTRTVVMGSAFLATADKCLL